MGRQRTVSAHGHASAVRGQQHPSSRRAARGEDARRGCDPNSRLYQASAGYCTVLARVQVWELAVAPGWLGRWRAVRNLIRWIARYGDDVVAILLTSVLFVLGWQDVVGTTAVNNTILLVLAVMIAGNLRDRYNVSGVHRRMLSELTSSAEVRVLPGSQVVSELRAARLSTDFWHFRGGTGTYLRPVTLPECDRLARQLRRDFSLYIEIIDPSDVDLCRLYANFRASVGPVEDEEWSIERAQKEAYATILAACWFAQHSELMHIEVRLSNRMTTFRWDMSSESIIQTQENAAGQALLFPRGKTYYGYWRLELERSFAQAKKVPIAEASEAPLGREPSVDEVRALFRTVGLLLPSSYTDQDVARVMEKALRPRDPYSNGWPS